jgi:hypothetical protein
MTKKRRITWKWINSLEDLEYADDICLLSHTHDHIQSRMNDLCRESRKAGLMINYAKTKEMRVNNTTDRTITIENREIKRVTDFCYLGGTVSENGGAALDVRRRNQKAQGNFAKL